LRVFYDPIVRQFYQSDHTASSMSLYFSLPSFFSLFPFSQFLFYPYLVQENRARARVNVVINIIRNKMYKKEKYNV